MCTAARVAVLAVLAVSFVVAEVDFSIPNDKCAVVVASNENGDDELFIQGTDGAFYHKYELPEGYSEYWSNWISLGGEFRGGPAVTRSSDGRLQVFGRSKTNDIWHKYQAEPNSLAWTKWEALCSTTPDQHETCPQFSSNPVAVLSAEGFIHLFAKGQDNTLMHKTQFTNNTVFVWTEWTSLGGTLTSQPSVTVDAEGMIHVFARGVDRALWHKAQVGGQQPRFLKWDKWETLGGVLASSPRVPVALNTVNLLDIYVRASDKAFWHRSQIASLPTAAEAKVDWKEWRTLGGVFASGPGVVIDTDGLIQTFGRGSDKAIWHKKQIVEGGALTWSPWTSLRGIISSGPTVRVRDDGIDVFVRSADGAIWHKGEKQQTNTSAPNGQQPVFDKWKSIGMDGGLRAKAFSC